MQDILSVEWMVAALILFFGCWLQTALGFGMALLAAPVIILFKPEWVPYILTWTALVLSVANTLHLYRFVKVGDMLPALITRIPGTMLGAWILLHISVLWLNVVVAISVLMAVVISFRTLHFDATPTRIGWAGFVSGVMGTTTSIGGPAMALVMQFGDPNTVRANLSLYFTYSCVLSLISYAFAGLMDWALLLICVSFLPCAALGFVLGLRSRSWVDQHRFRPLLLGLCGAAGVFALVGAIIQFLNQR